MSDNTKYGNSPRPALTLIRGGLSHELSPEEELERAIREWASRGKVNGIGRIAARALYDISEGTRFPNRVPVRVINGGLEGGATVQWAEEFGRLFITYARKKAHAIARRRGQSPNRAA